MTLLAAWLEKEHLTQRAFAQLLGVTHPIVSMWLSGVRRPGLDSALAIERVTRGAVPAESWTKGGSGG